MPITSGWTTGCLTNRPKSKLSRFEPPQTENPMNQTKHPSALRVLTGRNYPHSAGLARCFLLVTSILGLISLALPALAQTNMTIKPFATRVEVPTGFSGTMFFTNYPLRIPTNGATGVDGSGLNWAIADVNVSISGAPSGCTASLFNSDQITPVGTIPVTNVTTTSSSKTTNFVVGLTFDGTQTGGVTPLIITATGAGLPDDSFPLMLEVAKTWNGSPMASVNGAGSWSDITKWKGGGIPGQTDDVVFTEASGQTNEFLTSSTSTNRLTNSIVDTTTTIASLRFAQITSASLSGSGGNILTNWQNLSINDGQTLALAGPAGFSLLRDYSYGGNKLNVSIFGTNGTFVQTNEISSFGLFVDGQQSSILDMSGLGNMVLDVTNLAIGDCFAYPNYLSLCTNAYSLGSTVGGSRPQKEYITWKMPLTNVVKAVFVDPYNYNNASNRSYAMIIGRNDSQGGSSGNDYVVNMGRTNAFFMDSICVSGYGSLGSVLNFLNTNSVAVFRNADGVSRMSVFAVSDAAGTAGFGNTTNGVNTKGGSSTSFGADFTGNGNTVDMLVDRLYLAMDRGYTIGDGQIQSGMGFSKGTINANNVFVCYQASGNQTNNNQCTATLVVSNTATLVVNDTLTLGYTASSQGDPSAPAASNGKLNVGPGGTVFANDISIGGVTKTTGGNNISLTAGASLVVSNGIGDATAGGALGSLSLNGNSSLTLFVDGSKPVAAMVYLTNLNASGVGNGLIIGSVANESTFPVDVPLIAAVGSTISPSVFDAGVTMPAGMFGTLYLSTSNTINLHIINRTPHHLLWRAPDGGTGTANWDYTSLNWLDQDTGLTTNYNNPDFASFDDTAGIATNIVVAGGPNTITPAGLAMTNNSLYFTFMDGGNQIVGGPDMNKYGTGTLEVDATTAMTVNLNQGTLLGMGGLGGANLSAGTLMNFSGALSGSLVCAGVATSSGSISGTLTVSSGGVVTNNGTLSHSFSVKANAFLYNGATGNFQNIGTGSSASPQVSAGGIFINAGTIGAFFEGNVLFVNGTFEDLATSGITVNSVSIGSGGTFMPGGSGIGTTTINSDSSSTGFPGAVQMAQGSTNIFLVDPTVPQNTMLSSVATSFGGSATARTQNGCTLVISNITATPFSAGQVFRLFTGSSGASLLGNTGASTNTFPIIIPSTPGPGLVWDLRHLWIPIGSDTAQTNGLIGVVSAFGGPTLTNGGFTLLGTPPTNFVATLAWDQSNVGMSLLQLAVPQTNGINSTNPWTRIAGSWTNSTFNITNKMPITNNFFYRLSFP